MQLVVGQLSRIAIRAKERKDFFPLVERLLLLDLERDEGATCKNDVSESKGNRISVYPTVIISR
jgi:hypothetical protein